MTNKHSQKRSNTKNILLITCILMSAAMATVGLVMYFAKILPAVFAIPMFTLGGIILAIGLGFMIYQIIKKPDQKTQTTNPTAVVKQTNTTDKVEQTNTTAEVVRARYNAYEPSDADKSLANLLKKSCENKDIESSDESSDSDSDSEFEVVYPTAPPPVARKVVAVSFCEMHERFREGIRAGLIGTVQKSVSEL